MPRLARKYNKTITNTYHVIIRGINKKEIFSDEYDKIKFLSELKKNKEKLNIKVYIYVLMNNHVHMTICDSQGEISNLMHRLCTSYAMYFNKKYERVGHVFQNRFKSTCVDTEEYLLNLVRYIHDNPQKAGMCKTNSYRWSSYQDYIGNSNSGITDIDFILEFFSKDRKKAIEKFKEFSKKINTNFYDSRLEFDYILTDKEASEIIKSRLNINELLKIKNLNVDIRNQIIYAISRIEGIYPKQISRILEMSERNIQRIIKKYKEKEAN